MHSQKWSAALCGLVLFCCTACAQQPVSLAQQDDPQDARQACTDLVLDYAYYRDRPDAQAVANLFADDARDGDLIYVDAWDSYLDPA